MTAEIRREHSKTPWRQSALIGEANCVLADGDEIALCWNDLGEGIAVANARRIVAAVNATRDFTTEGLEGIAEAGLTLELALLASAELPRRVDLDEAQETAREAFATGRRGLREMKAKLETKGDES